MSDVVQTEAPQFVNLGLPAINTLNEVGILITPAARIQRPKDVFHWSVPDHVFGESSAVGTSVAKSDHGYSYKINLEILRGNHEYEHQTIQWVEHLCT